MPTKWRSYHDHRLRDVASAHPSIVQTGVDADEDSSDHEQLGRRGGDAGGRAAGTDQCEHLTHQSCTLPTHTTHTHTHTHTVTLATLNRAATNFLPRDAMHPRC